MAEVSGFRSWKDGLKIGILSFAAPPAVGGGAVYLATLANGAANHAQIDQLHLFSERQARGVLDDPMSGRDSVTMHRSFTRRATRPEGDYRDYGYFALQQFDFLRLSRQIAKLRLDGLLVHSDIVRRPTFVGVVVAAARKAGTRVILDVRDVSMTKKRKHVLDMFDSAIVCGLAPQQHIADLTNGSLIPQLIPVPFAPPPPVPLDATSSAEQLLKRHGLAPGHRYVLMTGGLTPAKGPIAAAETASALQKLSDTALPIVCCGPERISHPSIDAARAEGALIYLGRVDTTIHLALLEGASCVASFSDQEGLNRTILEAIHRKKRFFAPTNVPEFKDLPQLSGSSSERAQRILDALSSPAVAADYDLSEHNPHSVLALLSDAVRGRQPCG